MKWNEVFCNTFKSLREQIGPEVRKQVDMILPSMPMVEACRADDLDDFLPFIAAGKLSVEICIRLVTAITSAKPRRARPSIG